MDKPEQWSAIQAGSREAFSEVFTSYYPALCTYAAHLAGNRDDAEELVQDIFFRIWQDRASIQIELSLKSYLFRAVYHRVINQAKHRKVRASYAQAIRLDPEAELTEPEVEAAELRIRIAQAIEKLPEARRKVFQLVRLEGKKYQEAALELGISVKTVENQMGQALRFLREELRDCLPLILCLLLSIPEPSFPIQIGDLFI